MAGMGAADEVQLTDFKGIVEVMADGQRTLQKLHTSGNTWNAHTVSTLRIEGFESDRNGVSFVVSPSSSPNFMCGLASAAAGLHREVSTNVGYGSITFAVNVDNGKFRVFEKGSDQGQYGHVEAQDTVKVALHAVNRKVDYSVNGQVRYTSQLLPEFPLYVKCCAHNHGPLLEQLHWTSRELGGGAVHACPLRSITKQKLEIEVENQQLKAKLAVAEAENEAWRSDYGLLSNIRHWLASKKRRVEQAPPNAREQGVPSATT